MSIALLFLLTLSFIVQVVLYLFLFIRVNQSQVAVHGQPSVSVVVAIKNELENLKSNLDAWLSQDYKNYELIIVDDNSSDESYNFLKNRSAETSRLRITRNNQYAGKKGAMTTGISIASGEWILTTDADCLPADQHWISKAMSLAHDFDVILLYGPYLSQNSVLNKFIRYETWYIAMQYLSLAQIDFPYMGVGRNLAYKKEVFDKSGGYRLHDNLLSGDDDLFISSLKKKWRIGINLSAFTYSQPSISIVGLIGQKRRHLSTATSYPMRVQIMLSGIFLSHLLFYLSAFGLFLHDSYTFLVISILVARYLILLYVAHQKMNQLNEKKLWYWSPLLDMCLLLYYCLMGMIMTVKKKTW